MRSPIRKGFGCLPRELTQHDQSWLLPPSLQGPVCSEESNISPEESPEAQAVLNGHHHHVLMGREGQPVIGGRPAHQQTTSVDPHHHLDREEATQVTGRKQSWEGPGRVVWLVRTRGGCSQPPAKMGQAITLLPTPPAGARPPHPCT